MSVRPVLILLFTLFLVGGLLPSTAQAHLSHYGLCPPDWSQETCNAWNDAHNLRYGFGHVYHPGEDPFALFTDGCQNVVQHLATPIRIFACGDALQFYWVGNGQVKSGPTLWVDFPGGMADGTLLFAGVNDLARQPVIITYHAPGQVLRVKTYYADSMMDVNKPYVFDIDVDNQVSHMDW